MNSFFGSIANEAGAEKPKKASKKATKKRGRGKAKSKEGKAETTIAPEVLEEKLCLGLQERFQGIVEKVGVDNVCLSWALGGFSSVGANQG